MFKKLTVTRKAVWKNDSLSQSQNLMWPRVYFTGVITLLLCVANTTVAADLPNSKDPAGIKRYEGSEIIRYENIKYDQYVVPLGKITKFDFGTKKAEFEKSEPLEGAITRVSYRVADPQRSSLEVFRNYEQSLAADGWEIVWRASGKAEMGNTYTHLYESLRDNDQLFTYSDSEAHTLVARKQADGLTAVLLVTKFQDGLRRGVKVDKGDPIIQLDVIQTKKMEEKMVFVQASEMEKEIDKTGRIALYGILFDFNKTDIKSESEPVIAEVAKLLKEKPALSILVVGHTDNVGTFEFNRDLSQRRAAAVIAALSEKHGIAASRLMAFGASFAAPLASNGSEEGRAKNRRVEIVGLN